MASSRRRFLTTMGAAAAGAGVAGGARGAIPSGAQPGNELPRDAFSPAELLERHARQSAAAAAPGAGTAPAAGQTDPPMPSQAEVESWYRDLRNWGRWGDDDQKGAVNLITPEKSAAAARLVRNGRKVSMSRVFEPEQHFIRKSPRPSGAGACVDYLGFIYHGQTVTHIDALCHMWDVDGMWQGRRPGRRGDDAGSRLGRHRRLERRHRHEGRAPRRAAPPRRAPRHAGPSGARLGARSDRPRAQGVTVEPGDALLVYSGKDPYVRAGGDYGGGDRPGLSATCAKFVRDHDVSLLGWDMMDARPDPYNLAFPMHGVLFNFGVALLDNALLEPLADACAEEGRYEFMFMGLPLNVARGTGSPANPIAMF